jgi:hypothetical protein
MREASGRYESPVCNVAGEARRFGSEHQRSNGRVDTIGADHQISVSGNSVVKFHFDLIRVLDDADTSMIEMKHAVRQRGAEHLEQVGAMKVIVGRAEVLLA